MKNKTLSILIMAFVTATLASNIMAGKLMDFAGFAVPAGVIAFPISFAITDIVNEIWGKKDARTVVWLGFASSIAFSLFIMLAIALPAAPFWDLQPAFASVLGSVPRVAIGGLAAFLVSQNTDVWIYHKLKEMHGEKYLWVRNNVSTTFSQLLDSAIFITIAFFGTMPLDAMLIMILTQWVVKILLALVDTPFVYWGVRTLRRRFN